MWLRLQWVLKNFLINRLIIFQSPNALSSVLSQPLEESLVILVYNERSHPWKQDPEVTLKKQVVCLRLRSRDLDALMRRRAVLIKYLDYYGLPPEI